MGLVTLNNVKSYLGIGGVTYPAVSVDMTIDTVAGTITRASGDWATGNVSVGTLMTLAGFTNAENNVQVAVTEITSSTVLKYLGPINMVDEVGVGTSFNPADPSNDTTYDTFLTEQIEVISEAVEGYCNRKFANATYTQTIYKADFPEDISSIFVAHYPVSTLTSITEVDTSTAITSYRVQKPSGLIKLDSPYTFFANTDSVEIVYDAGYTSLPQPVQSAIYSLIEERYNKKLRGISLNFGPDVQRVSIPGAISIDFDYSLQANERKSAFGMILGNWANVLDFYRSERAILGDVREIYV